MSRRKVSYAKRACIDPEEEGEELPFEPRDIVIKKGSWVTDSYTFGEILGRGKFGEVKRCTEKSTGMVLAAKIIATLRESDKKTVRAEIEIQSELKHPKILQIYDAFEGPKQMCIVMELVEGGELFDRVVDPKFDLTERVAILFMRQIVDAVQFIHTQNILHLDLKPENVVCVAKTGTRIKIIDFGLALRYEPHGGQKIMAGTVDFMAPEVANFEDVSPATDMWSVGVICYVLVSGLSPFLGDNDNETISNITRVEYDFAAEEFEPITAGCKDFIKKLLVRDSRKRLTAKECMKHSWLQKITRVQTTRQLSKVHHLKFFTRRKWHKVITAVKAMNRLEKMSTLYMTRKLSKMNGPSTLQAPVPEHHMSSSPDSTSSQSIRHRDRSPRPEGPVVEEPKYDWKANMEARRRQRAAGNHEASPTISNTGNTVSNTLNSAIDVVPRSPRVNRSDRIAGLLDNAEQRTNNRQAGTDRTPYIPGHVSVRDRRNRLADIATSDNSSSKPPATRQGRLAAIAGNNLR